MLENPNHETKLKMLGFAEGMVEYKKTAQKFFLESKDLNTEKIEAMQEKEFDKIFKLHFQDTDDDRALFHSLVTEALWNFAHGRTIDVKEMKKDIENERQNLN